MSHLLALVLTATGTYALRAGAVHLLAEREMSARLQDALRHASLAVMAVIAASSMPTIGRAPTSVAVVSVTAAAVASRRISHLALIVPIGVAAGIGWDAIGA
jgi:uncharacterized membrane protein